MNRREEASPALPKRLSIIQPYRAADTLNAGQPKKFYIVMRHMNWTINGGTFPKEQVIVDEKVHINIFETWEFLCEGGGMGMM